MLKHLAQDLRNAFDAHDRVAHEEVLRRLEKLEAVIPQEGCARGAACICNKHAQEVCNFRLKK